MQKKFLYLLLSCSLCACEQVCIPCMNESQVKKNREIAKKIEGYYAVVKQEILYTIPLDLNYDGVANTDLFKEFTCYWVVLGYPHPEYRVEMNYCGGNDDSGYYFSAAMQIFYSLVDKYGTPVHQGCFNSATKYYDCLCPIMDTSSIEFQITDGNSIGSTYHWKGIFDIPKKLKWEENRIYFECDKDFYTELWGWQTVRCSFEFEKERDLDYY